MEKMRMSVELGAFDERQATAGSHTVVALAPASAALDNVTAALHLQHLKETTTSQYHQTTTTRLLPRLCTPQHTLDSRSDWDHRVLAMSKKRKLKSSTLG
ncbi:hypothetical protein CVT26_001070 [Gymnopilus dilepis]|uniref:Uncharacterized protein n=1 Tax=Gymnopilus dilepis TaxID=231916 RepID=A0A409WBI9_9AGAR|nr:hypothetical protein CVT26_001070 [Gymnopilus dilepis]